MGIFNWVFKGVNVVNKKAKTKQNATEVSLPESLDQTAAVPVAAVGGSVMPPEVSSAQRAASILFERTETNAFNAYNNGQVYAAANNVQAQDFSNALNGSTYGNRNILVVTPRTNVEVTQVVGNLSNGDACIVCLEGLDLIEAQRRLDFLSGVICALNGNIKKLNPNTYILTPSGIGVRN